MSRSIGRLWLFLFVPFVILVLSFTGLVVPHQDLWGHAAFHLIYLPVLAVSCWALWRFIGAAPTRTQRVIAGLMLFLQSIAIFGHAGELVTVIQNGFFNAPESIFKENPHMFFAKFAILGIMLSLVLLIALTITAFIQRRWGRKAWLPAS
ncbi:MAG: hypothetical protein E6J29_03865 [Chloroflexi bacterium]|nr:MAG: hypothetical protein E6J29_03865 [Chloroflexota bacterium]